MSEKAKEDSTKTETPTKLTAVKLSDIPLTSLQRIRALDASRGATVETKKGKAYALRFHPLRVSIVPEDQAGALADADDRPFYSLEDVAKEASKQAAALIKKASK